jgi:uncharacterized protein YcfJ
MKQIVPTKNHFMKRILPMLSIVAVVAVLLTACGRKGEETKNIAYADTAGLAQFQEWKYLNERAAADQYLQAVQRTPVNSAPARTTTRKTNYGSGSMNTVSQNQAKVAQKKGWSKAAKGAAIGGGAGAIAGAVLVKKNRVAGGAIGAIVGGGLGYIIGHAKDKKDGRVQ